MFVKVIIFCAALAATHASLIAPVGLGAPVLAAGPLGVGKGLIAAPAIATVSSQKSVINHVAPGAHGAVAPAPIALSSHGILTNGLIGGHGINTAPLTVGTGIYGAPVALGAGHFGLGHGVAVSSQKSVINHVAPAARVAVAPGPIALSSHGILTNGLTGGHGIAASPLAVGAGIYGAPVALGVGRLGLGHGDAVSSQKSVINHVAPAARVAVAPAPVALTSHGIYGNGIVASNGLLANGIVGGHGVAAAPLAIGNGLLGAPGALGHGAALSSQNSVISHVAPSARVAVAAAPVTLAHNGVFSNGLIGGHGIIGNGLIAGAPLGIAGHGISALPLSIGSGIHGAPIALGLGKTIL